MRRRSLAGLAAALIGAFAVDPGHAKTPPQACAPGAFAFDSTAAVAIGTMVGTSVSHLEIGQTGEIRIGPCATAGKIKAKRKATPLGGGTRSS
jgi:hypothetical protein